MNHIAAVHTIKTKIGMSDADYRIVLNWLFGVTTSKHLNPLQQARLRLHFDNLAKQYGLAQTTTHSTTEGSL